MSRPVLAAVLTSSRNIEIQDFEMPVATADTAVLRVEGNGICGSDVHWRAHATNVPRVIGHEVAGRIWDIGPAAAKRWGVQVGDRVAVEAGIPCGACEQCDAGFEQLCTPLHNYGVNLTLDQAPGLWGGCAEFMQLMPNTKVTKLAPEIGGDVAAGWFSPLANAVEWLGQEGCDIQAGQTVIIMGPGSQGLAACLVAKRRGASQVILVGLQRDRRRLEAGRSLGADHLLFADGDVSLVDAVRELTDGRLAHAVLDVSGSNSAAATAPLLLRPRGVITAASPIDPDELIGMPMAVLVWNQLRWQGVLSNRQASAAPAADLLAENIDLFAPLVTHRFALADTSAAIDVVEGGGEDVIKSVVCIPAPDGSPA